MYPDSGAHSGLWPLWGEQSGGDSEGGSQGSRAEAVATVQGDNDGGVGFIPQEPWEAGPRIRQQDTTQPHHPPFSS